MMVWFNFLFFVFNLSFVSNLWGNAAQPAFPSAGIVTEEMDSFFDERIDYSKISARITDKDRNNQIIKIHSESANVRFFRAGDSFHFRVGEKSKDECEGFVRGIEENYFVAYVKDFLGCQLGDSLRRGTVIHIRSEILSTRVKDASLYRVVLLRKRGDFLNQLNNLNHFIWTYDQERAKAAAEFEKKIIEIHKEKQRALDFLVMKRRESIVLQKELVKNLDVIDKDLDFYRIQRQELFIDRWHLDHDLGLPVGDRPQDTKDAGEVESLNRWHQSDFK